MANKKSPKSRHYKYICTHCDYRCSKISDFTKHNLTAKHLRLINPNEKSPKIANAYICNCGKSYKHMSSLCKHRTKCNIYTQQPIDIGMDIDIDSDYVVSMCAEPSAIIEILKQNQEFKQLMVDQNHQMHETQKQLQQSYDHNTELQNKMVEMLKDGKTINNTNNQTFNLNFFLNDTCKDAMSITDFILNIDVTNEELEYIGHNGYVSGMTKMIMDRLKNMDVTKRPIHCTDIKRETMYIKEENGWCKDTEELSKLRKILSRISMNNYRSVPNWRNAHPESEIIASRTYDFCYRMMQALLGDVEDEQIKLDNKIIKTMAKDLYINKIKKI